MVRKKLIIVLILCIFATSIIIYMNLIKRTHYSTFIWKTEEVIRNDDTYFEFLNSKNIKQLSLYINRDIRLNEYRKFITRANKYGISVYALDGSPYWVSTEKSSLMDFLNWVEDYQTTSSHDQLFEGLQLDCEFYLIENNIDGSVINSFKSIITKSSNLAGKLNISLDVVIPFWFDSYDYDGNTSHISLAEWIIINSDSISVMAYRNFSKGKNGIIDITSDEVELINLHNKSINIILETRESDENGHLSFYGYSSKSMQEEIDYVLDYYNSKNVNISIHYLKTWKEMKE